MTQSNNNAISPRLARLLGDRTKVIDSESDILFLFGVDHESDEGGLSHDDIAALESESSTGPTERPVPARDLSAMLILHRIAPTERFAIGSTKRDVVYFRQCFLDLVNGATVEDILNLRRCGVFFSEDSMAAFT